MPPKVDLVGQRFGRLLVKRQAGLHKSYKVLWECICDCGNTKIVISTLLVKGSTRSCGCLFKEALMSRNTKHGHGTPGAKTPEFITWMNIKQRCTNPKNSHYKWYGGKGIRVCERWDSFDNFLSDMGLRPSSMHSIERLNNDRDYEPSNCVWGTRDQQARNKSTSRFIEYNGERLILADWARRFGCRDSQILYFLNRGKGMAEIEQHIKSRKYAKKKAA